MKKINNLKKIAEVLAPALIDRAPNLIENIGKKKEENVIDRKKGFIFALILTIFVTKLEYINMFSNNIINALINILFGLIVFILICLFLEEEKEIYKIDSTFFKFLFIVLIALGFVNSFYHIGYAIFKLFI